jgi:hypothetical protein
MGKKGASACRDPSYPFLWTILKATVRIGKRKGMFSAFLEQFKIEDE